MGRLFWYVFLAYLLGLAFGIGTHEYALSKKFNETGNAGAWFFPIVCEQESK